MHFGESKIIENVIKNKIKLNKSYFQILNFFMKIWECVPILVHFFDNLVEGVTDQDDKIEHE